MIEIVVVDFKMIVVQDNFLYQIFYRQFWLLLNGVRQIFDDFFFLLLVLRFVFKDRQGYFLCFSSHSLMLSGKETLEKGNKNFTL